MGYFLTGKTLPWSELQPQVERIRHHALRQFCRLYNRCVSIETNDLLFGEEIEALAVHFSPSGHATLDARGEAAIEEWNSKDEFPGGLSKEYAKYMVEHMPKNPYGSSVDQMVAPELDARRRRAWLNTQLAATGSAIMTLSVFPMMGVGPYTTPALAPGGEVTESLLASDQVLNSHPRFATLTANIRKRRGCRVCILPPAYNDTHTTNFDSFVSIPKTQYQHMLHAAQRDQELTHEMTAAFDSVQDKLRELEADALIDMAKRRLRCPRKLQSSPVHLRSRSALLYASICHTHHNTITAPPISAFGDTYPGILSGGIMTQNQPVQEVVLPTATAILPVPAPDSTACCCGSSTCDCKKQCRMASCADKLHALAADGADWKAVAACCQSAMALGCGTALPTPAPSPPPSPPSALSTLPSALAPVGVRTPTRGDGQFAFGAAPGHAGAHIDLVRVATPHCGDDRAPLRAEAPVHGQRTTDWRKTAAVSHVYGDAMALGMGCCGLQCTFQCRNVAQARHVHDLFIPLCAPFSALVANSPIFRGVLTGSDTRYGLIADSVDDRPPVDADANGRLLARGRLGESRFGISCAYISLHADNCPAYNDILVPAHAPTLRTAVKMNFDPLLALHVAHVFSRSPLVVYESEIAAMSPALVALEVAASVKDEVNDEVRHEELDLSRLGGAASNDVYIEYNNSADSQEYSETCPELSDDSSDVLRDIVEEEWPSTSLFEGMQSANWQTVRFKPPPGPGIGWRVEFRPCDAQITDFESGALVALVNLTIRTALIFGLTFYIPISDTHDNFVNSLRSDAVLDEHFVWRTDLFSAAFRDLARGGVYESAEQAQLLAPVRAWAREHYSSSAVWNRRTSAGPDAMPDIPLTAPMTVRQILDGEPALGYCGLIPLIRAYIALCFVAASRATTKCKCTCMDTLQKLGFPEIPIELGQHLAKADAKSASHSLLNGCLDCFVLERLDSYLRLFSLRASGELPTGAAWQREFVRRHPAYTHDSVVPVEAANDLCRAATEMGACEPGNRYLDELLGGLADIARKMPQNMAR